MLSIKQRIAKLSNQPSVTKSSALTKSISQIDGNIDKFFKSLNPKKSKKTNESLIKYRKEQVDLASCIYKTLKNNSGVSIFESPTGTGKTLAYLAGACQYVKDAQKAKVAKSKTKDKVKAEKSRDISDKDADGKVVIATTTRYLQQQALKDFEKFLSPYYPSVQLRMLKGKTNYISKSRLESEILLYKDSGMTNIIDTLNNLSNECDNVKICGDVTILSQSLIDDIKRYDIDINALLIKEADNDQEHLHYYYQAKKAANDADIVITNHHSFAMRTLFKNFADLPFSNRKVIIDEAHEFEKNVFELARRSVAYTTVKTTISHLISFMEDDKKKYNNKKGIKTQDIKAIKRQYNEVSKIIDTVKEECKKDERSEILISESIHANSMRSKNNDMHNVAYESVFNLNSAVAKTLATVNKIDRITSKRIKNNKGISPIIEKLHSYKETLSAICLAIKANAVNEMCYLVKFSDKEKFPSVYRVTTNLWSKFTEIWKGYDSIILLSGTIADEDEKSFNRIKSDLHLNSYTSRHISFAYEKQYKGFNYKKNITAYLYPNVPMYVYNDKDTDIHYNEKSVIAKYVEDITPYVERIISGIKRCKLPRKIKATKQGVLILTASHLETKLLESRLLEKFTGSGVNIITYTPWCGESLSERIRQFEESKGVLISASAWTGVDIKDTISDLVITRIPNMSPDDPIIKAEKFNKRNSNYVFIKSRYKTFIKTRQGMGRLCRKETDKGNIHILDARVVNNDKYKYYYDYIQKKFTLRK